MYYYHIFTLGSLTFILKVTPKPILRTLNSPKLIQTSDMRR